MLSTSSAGQQMRILAASPIAPPTVPEVRSRIIPRASRYSSSFELQRRMRFESAAADHGRDAHATMGKAMRRESTAVAPPIPAEGGCDTLRWWRLCYTVGKAGTWYKPGVLYPEQLGIVTIW